MARTDAAWPGQSDRCISLTLVQPTLLSQSVQQINRTSTAFFLLQQPFLGTDPFYCSLLNALQLLVELVRQRASSLFLSPIPSIKLLMQYRDSIRSVQVTCTFLLYAVYNGVKVLFWAKTQEKWRHGMLLCKNSPSKQNRTIYTCKNPLESWTKYYSKDRDICQQTLHAFEERRCMVCVAFFSPH